jgi:hypothetical protein
MVAVMRSRIVLMLVIVVVTLIGTLAEFRLHRGMADAVLAGKPLLDGADGPVCIDTLVEAGMQRRHVA